MGPGGLLVVVGILEETVATADMVVRGRVTLVVTAKRCSARVDNHGLNLEPNGLGGPECRLLVGEVAAVAFPGWEEVV